MSDNVPSLEGCYNVYSDKVQQMYPDTCAIKSQQLILESNGLSLSETELRNEAIQNGWYTPGYGTPMEDVGNILENHGVAVQKYVNARTEDLAKEVTDGHQVIVGVDSGELWNPGHGEFFEDIICGGQADHALIVSGLVIDPFTSEQNILLTDPGMGGVCIEYPIEQFEDAWNDSNNFMVVAN